jgi:hypothetical protein
VPDDEDVVDYDMDTEDEQWLATHNSCCPTAERLDVVQFETIFSRLEHASLRAPVRASEAAAVTRSAEAPARALHGYFSAKLARCGGYSVSPLAKAENPGGGSETDPYVAFRRRTERMQTRRHRQKDEQAYSHMLKLRRDLEQCRAVLLAVRTREQQKLDLLRCERQVLPLRVSLEDWSGQLEAALTPAPPPPPALQPADVLPGKGQTPLAGGAAMSSFSSKKAHGASSAGGSSLQTPGGLSSKGAHDASNSEAASRVGFKLKSKLKGPNGCVMFVASLRKGFFFLPLVSVSVCGGR